MTDAERIAILEEVALRVLPISLHDMVLRRSTSGGVQAFKLDSSLRELSSKEGLVEAVYAARQKLAAERVAAMTPNERKYKAALEHIVEKCSSNDCCSYAAQQARKALEDS